ncbi:MAG: starch-binding protein [Roseburia sp.]|nr:starch-binding protein [Anaeroplasma bactoclasticum]MCM1195970.1 starch-binding protein [Roseburia sp.]MCM1556418.1 starch-binding protein [Anaeroplasma bactoclasticum]
MKKILKTLAFVLVSVLALTAFASCEQEHKHTYKYESDNTKHRQVCEECDEKTEYEAHEWGEWTVTKEATLDSKGSRKHTCTVCGKEVAEDIEEKKPALGALTSDWNAVYVQAPTDWEEVYIHYFNNDDKTAIDENYTCVWPGKQMTLVDETSHLYGYQVPKGVSGLVINNGAGTQTVDIATSTERNLYVISENVDGENHHLFTYKSHTPAANEPELAKPEVVVIEKVTIYAQLPATWDAHMIYYWGTSSSAAWPGDALTLVDEEKSIYKCENITSTAALIFNNGKNDKDPANIQTANLSIPEGVDAYIVSEDGKSVQFGKYENGEIKVIDLGLPELWIVGSFTNWGFADESNKLATDELAKKATITVKLSANDEFKVCDSSWGNEIALTAVEGFSGGNGANIKCETTGVYIITVDFSGDTPAMSIAPLALYCVGSHNGWGDGFVAASKLTLAPDGATASITVALAANTEFKVCDSSWGHEAALTAVDGFSGGNGANIKCEVAGTYLITVSNLTGTPTITITAA